ncbi:hypothetical protein VTN00DRAFT_7422 [Thermoascus crustaceus]|uniref:uncharacterized protein n=1 Tax=Thermoascus crustaceus TaxID=5088 RepID=UPI00374315AF
MAGFITVKGFTRLEYIKKNRQLARRVASDKVEGGIPLGMVILNYQMLFSPSLTQQYYARGGDALENSRWNRPTGEQR